ncbi:MAG: InlB B-repeat-containing protein, partial [Kosmotogaceae bacterium]
WEVNGEFYSSHESTTLLMNSNKEVKVFFSNDSDGYILTTIVEGDGLIEIEPEKNTYSRGEIVELEAIPDNCSSFVKWDGDIVSKNRKVELVMDDNKIIYAVFKENDVPPSIEIVSPQPVPEYINDLSKEFEFSFSSNNKNVNISKVSVEVSSGEGILGYEINGDSGQGTFIWDFDIYEAKIFETFYATITVEDECRNVASESIQITVDNISPELKLEVDNFEIVDDSVETTLSWIATDSCLDRVSFDVNQGTVSETKSYNSIGKTIWKIPLDKLNGEALFVKATAYDRAENTEFVTKTIPVRKLTMRVNSENAGSVSPAPGDHYYPSSVRIGISATPNLENVFDKWIATAGSFEDETSTETIYLMPDQNATITANFTPIWKGFTENYSILQQTANVEIEKPTNVKEGDIVIIMLHTNNRINDKWVNDPSSSQGFSIIGHSSDESSYERPTVSAAYKIAGENEPSLYSFKISREMHWYVAAICIHKPIETGKFCSVNSGKESVESITFDNITTIDKSLIIAAVTQRKSIASDYDARSFVPPQGMKERYSHYTTGPFGEDGKPNASAASRFLKIGETIQSPTYSWDYTGRAAGIMFEIIIGD